MLAGGKCVGEWVGGLVVCTMWVCGNDFVLAGGSVWVNGWVGGGRYHVGLWKWVGVGWWEVCG